MRGSRSCLTLLIGLAVLVAGCSDSSGPPPDVTLDVRLGLVRDQDGLAAAAFDRNDPASDRYGQFVDPTEIAARFGASPADRRRVLDALARRGVDASVDPTGGVVSAPMRAERAADLFDVRFGEGTTDDGRTYVQPRGPVRLPDDLDGLVDEVVGLTRTVPDAEDDAAPRPVPDDEVCRQSTATTQSIHDRYGIGALVASGAEGEMVSVGIPATDDYQPEPMAVWADCLGIPEPPVTVVEAGVHVGGNEVELDVATLVAVAPQVDRIEVVEFDALGWAGEPYLALLAGEDRLVDVVSSSETYCETALGADDLSLTEWTLASMAAAGVTIVVASGDRGSSGCAPGDEGLAVEYPASSPFVTAVGGTQPDAGAPPPGESVWLDSDEQRAGGGGESAVLPGPPYQTAERANRVLPDVAYLAEPSAWPRIPVCDHASGECRWARLGGTSAAAPLFAGGAVLLRQAIAADDRVAPGLLNALLATYASTPSPGASFDVTHGDNALFTDACCAAAPGFDPASGWGAVNLADLAAAARRAPAR